MKLWPHAFNLFQKLGKHFYFAFASFIFLNSYNSMRMHLYVALQYLTNVYHTQLINIFITYKFKVPVLNPLLNYSLYVQSDSASLTFEVSEFFFFFWYSSLCRITSVLSKGLCVCDRYQASDTHLNCSIAWHIGLFNPPSQPECLQPEIKDVGNHEFTLKRLGTISFWNGSFWGGGRKLENLAETNTHMGSTDKPAHRQ